MKIKHKIEEDVEEEMIMTNPEPITPRNPCGHLQSMEVAVPADPLHDKVYCFGCAIEQYKLVPFKIVTKEASTE